MTDAMFTFAWYAYAIGQATGKFPGARANCASSAASPRYQLYPTRDGKLVACGALEQKFWLAFCNTIGLPAPLMNDLADPEATKARHRGDHRGRNRRALAAEIRRRRLLRHHHGVARRGAARSAFRRARAVRAQVAGASGATMPALPVPIAATLRERAGGAKPSPKLGADNGSAAR